MLTIGTPIVATIGAAWPDIAAGQALKARIPNASTAPVMSPASAARNSRGSDRGPHAANAPHPTAAPHSGHRLPRSPLRLYPQSGHSTSLAATKAANESPASSSRGSGMRVVPSCAGPRAGRPGQEQPAAYRFKKHTKSLMLSTGLAVLPSQLAYRLPAAYRCWKQMKSLTFSTGGVELESQLA